MSVFVRLRRTLSVCLPPLFLLWLVCTICTYIYVSVVYGRYVYTVRRMRGRERGWWQRSTTSEAGEGQEGKRQLRALGIIARTSRARVEKEGEAEEGSVAKLRRLFFALRSCGARPKLPRIRICVRVYVHATPEWQSGSRARRIVFGGVPSLSLSSFVHTVSMSSGLLFAGRRRRRRWRRSHHSHMAPQQSCGGVRPARIFGLIFGPCA